MQFHVEILKGMRPETAPDSTYGMKNRYRYFFCQLWVCIRTLNLSD